MRQILIEKYVEPSRVEIEPLQLVTNEYHVTEIWLNEDGDAHSILGHPAEVNYIINKKK
jgi:hypothetical protein